MSPQPMPTVRPTPTARAAASLLGRLGVTHVVTVPDNTSAPVLAALEEACEGSGSGPVETEPGRGGGEPLSPSGARGWSDPAPRIPVLYATREGEAIALASGLWLGGGRPVVVLQNTGLLEAGDGLRGTASRMGAPLLLLVTCRGYAHFRAAGLDPALLPLGREDLVRPDWDSVALMTERTLAAWGIPFLSLTDPRDLSPIREAWERAWKDGRPVAVLVERAFE